MTRSFILLLFFLAACSSSSPQWTKPGASPGDVTRDMNDCKQEAMSKIPPQMAPAYPEPTPGGNQLIARRPEPGSTLPPSATRPASVTDLNAGERERYINACMTRR